MIFNPEKYYHIRAISSALSDEWYLYSLSTIRKRIATMPDINWRWANDKSKARLGEDLEKIFNK